MCIWLIAGAAIVGAATIGGGETYSSYSEQQSYCIDYQRPCDQGVYYTYEAPKKHRAHKSHRR